MKRYLTASAAAALLLLPAMGLAQTTAPQSTSPSPPPLPGGTQSGTTSTQPAPMGGMTQAAPGNSAGEAGKLSAGDRSFLNKAAADGMAEVELGKLGASKAQNDQVKQFAQKMVQDHGQANDKLMAIAQQLQVQPPAKMDAKHQQASKKLSGTSGASFDRQFMQHMLKDHQQAVKLFDTQAKSGQNEELKKFAADTLPTLLQHLAEAKQISSQMAPQTSQAPGSKATMNGATGSGGKSASTTRTKRTSTGTAARSSDPSQMSADQLNELELLRHQQMRTQMQGGQMQGGTMSQPGQFQQPQRMAPAQ
jgi:putative membrane protein